MKRGYIQQDIDIIARLLDGTPVTTAGRTSVYLGADATVHPIDTIDGIAALWSEHAKGWDWTVSKGIDVNRNYSAEAFSSDAPIKHEFVEDMATELEARTALLARVLEAEKAR